MNVLTSVAVLCFVAPGFQPSTAILDDIVFPEVPGDVLSIIKLGSELVGFVANLWDEFQDPHGNATRSELNLLNKDKKMLQKFSQVSDSRGGDMLSHP